MAETAKILTPEKTVVVPDLEAGCSLADGCPAPLFAEWLKKYPGHTVVSYINCSAGVKALSDVIVTSSSAEVILRQIPDPVVFAPDRNLAAWLEKKLDRKFVVWPGTCVVHETFSEKKLLDLMARHPEAEVIAHPECEERILRHAAVVASTSGLLKHVATSPKHVVHRGDRGGHPPPDAPGGAGQDADPRAAGRGLRVQHLPAHEAQHAREALPLPARPRAADRGARGRPASGRSGRIDRMLEMTAGLTLAAPGNRG